MVSISTGYEVPLFPRYHQPLLHSTSSNFLISTVTSLSLLFYLMCLTCTGGEDPKLGVGLCRLV